LDLLSAPFWLVMASFVAFAVGLGCGLHIVVHRTVPYAKLVEHNDVAGFMIAVVGALYSVLIAFVVVVVWQQYNDSDRNYGDEVSTVADIYDFSESLAPPQTRAIQALADQYIVEMIDDEWPAMRAGQASDAATTTLARLLSGVAGIVPRSAVENDTREHLHVSAQHLYDLRNERLSDNAESLPPVLWMALLVGAGITVGFGYLFGVANIRIHLVMTGAVAALIAVMFTLLVELDYPFRRDTAISPMRWTELQRYLRTPRGAFVPSVLANARDDEHWEPQR
jgi:hypothetical protein